MKILLFVSHPFELWFNSFVYKHLENKGYEIAILIGKSIDTPIDYSNLIKVLYSKKVTVHEIYLPVILKSLRKIFSNYKNTKNIRNQLKSIQNHKEYILICHDKSRLNSRIIMSEFNNGILIQTQEKYSRRSYRLSKIETIVDLILSLTYRSFPNIVFKVRGTNNIRYLKLLCSKFKVVYREGGSGTKNSIRICQARSYKVPPRKILFIGFRHTAWDFVNENLRTEIIDECVRIINEYPNSEISYIPHPRESENEFRYLIDKTKASIKLLPKNLPAEIIFTLDKEIDLCIGFGSTALASAQSMGIPIITIYKKIKLAKEITEAFDQIIYTKVKFKDDFTDMNALDKALESII